MFYTENTPDTDWVKVLSASSSAAGLNGYETIDNHHYGDGSIMYLADVGSVVERCRELGVKEENIYLDAALPVHTNLDLTQMTGDETTLNIIGRTAMIYIWQRVFKDLEHAI